MACMPRFTSCFPVAVVSAKRQLFIYSTLCAVCVGTAVLAYLLAVGGENAVITVEFQEFAHDSCYAFKLALTGLVNGARACLVPRLYCRIGWEWRVRLALSRCPQRSRRWQPSSAGETSPPRSLTRSLRRRRRCTPRCDGVWGVRWVGGLAHPAVAAASVGVAPAAPHALPVCVPLLFRSTPCRTRPWCGTQTARNLKPSTG